MAHTAHKLKKICLCSVMVIPIWKIYSYWAFFMTFLWHLGYLPFSPLVSVIFTFLGSIVLPLELGSVTQAHVFIIVTHIIPLWSLRHTPIEVTPNVLVFLVYNLCLLVSGTTYRDVYTDVVTHQPQTIQGYLKQRGLM